MEQRGVGQRDRGGRRGVGVAGAALGAIVAYDLAQRRHAILRNFPFVGHFRYLLEAVGPELRQYIVTSNNDERPFSRDQRRWVEASSKRQRNTFGFGTDDEVEAVDNLLIVKHSPFPVAAPGEGEPGGLRITGFRPERSWGVHIGEPARFARNRW